MSRHNLRVTLSQMLTHAREALALTAGRTRSDLDSNRLLNLSLVRLLEIIGEAATRVPVEARTGMPQIPWVQIMGLRNRLIHGYDQVDFDVLWQILNEDLPSLVKGLENTITRIEE